MGSTGVKIEWSLPAGSVYANLTNANENRMPLAIAA